MRREEPSSEQHYNALRFVFTSVTDGLTSVVLDYELTVKDGGMEIYLCATFECLSLPVFSPNVTLGM